MCVCVWGQLWETDASHMRGTVKRVLRGTPSDILSQLSLEGSCRPMADLQMVLLHRPFQKGRLVTAEKCLHLVLFQQLVEATETRRDDL